MLERLEQIEMELLVSRKPGQTEEVVNLACKNDDCDSGCETCRDGIRDEADERACLKHAHQYQHDAGNESGEQQVVDPVLKENDGENGDHCTGRAADLNARAAEDRYRGARYNC